VVHVGPPKTATTYVQRELFANADILFRHGVYLPRSGRLELEPRAVCHHHLAWELTGSPRFRSDLGGWDSLVAELEGSDGDVALVSSEELARAVTVPDVAARLLDRLRSTGRKVTVVYVVRDQLSQINSFYAQQVKMLEPVDAFVPHVTGMLRRGEADLESLTACWRSAPEVEFVAVPFPQMSESDPLVALLRAARVGVAESELEALPDTVNITLGPIAVEAIRLLRAYLSGLDPSFSHDDIAARRLHRIAAREAKGVGWCDDPFWGWSPALAARAAQRLEPSNQRFAHAVWGTGWPLAMPVDRPRVQTNLLRLPPAELERVHVFVLALARRYVTLRSGRSEA
jgi:hypothetical protein